MDALLARAWSLPHALVGALAGFAALLLLLLLLLRWRARPPPRRVGPGHWALITGAGGGLGRALAVDFACAGSSLALWDVDADALRATHAAVLAAAPSFAGVIALQLVDVSNAAQVAAAAADVLRRTAAGVVDVVVSNAGVVAARDVDALTAADVRRTLSVNVEAAFSLLRALLPPAKAAGRGCFVLVSSVMGLVGSARLADYCASKWALLGLAESVRLELARDGHAGVAVVALCPYALHSSSSGLFAGIFADARDVLAPLRAAAFPLLPAATVSGALLRAVRRGGHAVVVVPAALGPLAGLARALLPLRVHDAFVGLMGGTHGMSSFVGGGGGGGEGAGGGGTDGGGGGGGGSARRGPIRPTFIARHEEEGGGSSSGDGNDDDGGGGGGGGGGDSDTPPVGGDDGDSDGGDDVADTRRQLAATTTEPAARRSAAATTQRLRVALPPAEEEEALGDDDTPVAAAAPAAGGGGAALRRTRSRSAKLAAAAAAAAPPARATTRRTRG